MAATRAPFIPPGGFAGFSQQTPAVRALLAGPRRKTTRKKTTRKKTTRKKTARRKTARKKTGGRLVKGSAAAKRRMKQLRAMQKKKRRR